MKTYLVSYKLYSDKTNPDEFSYDQIYSNFVKANSKEEAKKKFEDTDADIYDVSVDKEMNF